jgi:hypothetical protein
MFGKLARPDVFRGRLIALAAICWIAIVSAIAFIVGSI